MSRIDFVSLFPEMVLHAARVGVSERAERRGIVRFGAANPRDFCYDRHRKVDDAPFGGEPGMLIRAEPVALALESLAPAPDAAVVLTSPTGMPFDQAAAEKLTRCEHIVLLCGRYEGFDHRVETRFATHAYSIGDYVLSGGELAALVIADAVVRLLPGVLGSADSLRADSHAVGLLAAPNYTRPEIWRGEAVPPVLLSGDHKAVRRWRRAFALRSTRRLRPDLLARAPLSKADLGLLQEAPAGGVD